MVEPVLGALAALHFGAVMTMAVTACGRTGEIMLAATGAGLAAGTSPPAARLTPATALAIGAAGALGTAQSLKRLVQRPALDDRRVLADQLGQIFGRRRDCHRLDSDAGALHHLASAAGLVRQDECHHVTLFAGARSAAGTMQERFGVGRRIGLHDQRHIMDVDAASGHVGGNQYAYQALLERQQVAVTLLLAEVALQIDRGNALVDQFLRHLLGLELGAREQDALAGAAGQQTNHLMLVALRHFEHMMGHRVDLRDDRTDRMHFRIRQEPLDQRVHAVVERRREQHTLTA